MIDAEGKSKCDYDMVGGKWYPYEELWHTGQAIYGLVEAYRVLKDDELLKAAIKSGDWWIDQEFKDDPWLKGMINAAHGDKLGNLINFTTITDGTNGIFELYRASNNSKYAETCVRAGDWMIENMYLPEEGMFYNILDVDNKKVWTDKSPHHDVEKASITQVARPNNEGYLFYDLYLFTKDEKYKEVFINLCESLVRRQGKEGLWMDFEPNNPETGQFHPRFNLWYAESLLKGYELINDKRYLEAALKTARFYRDFQQKDGTFYYFQNIDGSVNKNSVTGSAVSFAGIIWLQLKQLGYDEFDKSIETSVKWVLKNRFPEDHPDPNLQGAFFETRTKNKKKGYQIMMRDIATSFGLRFLSNYYLNAYQ